MREGNKIAFEDGYFFYETLHGPVIEVTCEACGNPTFAAEYRQRQAREERDPPWDLCGTCAHDLWFET